MVSLVDAAHGSLLATYDSMGKPAYPTPAQIEKLRKSAELPAPEAKAVKDGMLQLTLPPDGLALIELR